MPVFTSAGAQIHYTDQGEGPLVVLAHGIGGNHAIWFRQIATLSQVCRVVAFDHRGFGLSTDPDGKGRAAFAGDLLNLLDHLDAEKAVLVGQSMGGGTSICFTGLHPERVSGLVISASLHGLIESPAVKEIMDAARRDTEELDQLDRVLSPDYRADHRAEAVLYRAISGFNRIDRRSLRGDWPLLQTPQHLASRGIPVLMIAGARDRLFPIEAMRQAQAEMEGSFMVEIDGAGHSAFFEQPDLFNDSLLSFLQMCRLTGRSKGAHSDRAGYVA
jgi:pimeloyl-ACP methyl ester carboxylesterase